MTRPERMETAAKPVSRSGLLLLTVFTAIALCGCAAKVELSGGTVRDNIQSITAVVTPEDLEKLDGFEQLGSADFTGSSCYAELADWAERHPLVETRYTVAFPNGAVAENNAHELDLTGLKDADLEEALENLAYLPRLKSVNLGSDEDGLSPAGLRRFRERWPELEFAYHCQLLGKDSNLDETKLDLTNVPESKIRANLDTIACMENLKTIELGSDEEKNAPGWKLIRALEEAAPEAKIHYRFTLYDVPLTLENEEVDISYHYVADGWPEVLEIAACMPKLKTLLMDTCAVGNEEMEKIRDALPDTEVVWRINFGGAYTARTNETRILASSPSVGGALGNSDVAVFKYFTKMKYLDIGHNEQITDLSFARYMPDLEVLIIAMNPLGDLSPLADCPKLEYLELFYSMTDDLSPLAGLKNLKHLNVGHCPKLTDISPIYDLDLERFYLGTFASCPVPPEQVDHYRELHPDCEVDNESWESSDGAWRRAFLEGEKLEWYKKQPYYSEERAHFAPRYALLRDQMGYDGLLYSTKWIDPTWQYVGW